MKPFLLFTFLLICLSSSTITKANDPESPVEYMNAISSAHYEMNKTYLAYMSAAAHSSRKRKIEKMRLAALESINNSLSKTNDLPYFKGDNSLRKSSLDYIKMCYNVFNDDYSKIVNMEEIAEQSYDFMQAFILLQQKTDEKLNQAYETMAAAEKAFAAKYNVTLTETKSDFGDMMIETGKIGKYRNNIYLIFFKCNWEDNEIVKAMNEGKFTVAEQARTAQIKYANEGLAGLDSLKSFNGDVSLASCCKRLLEFYKRSAENDIPKQLGFYLKKENFEKMKKSFEAKGSRSKPDVDVYNAAINEMNKASNSFNDISQRMNTERNEKLNEWNETTRNFADAHTPHYK